MAQYVCKYCGVRSTDTGWTGRRCYKSPHGTHVVFDMTNKEKFVCKYCGVTSSDPGWAGHSCSKAPHGYHELLE